MSERIDERRGLDTGNSCKHKSVRLEVLGPRRQKQMYPFLDTFFCVLDALLEAVITILLNSAVKRIATPCQPVPGLSSPHPMVRESSWEQGCFNHYLGGIVLRMCDVLVNNQ